MLVTNEELNEWCKNLAEAALAWWHNPRTADVTRHTEDFLAILARELRSAYQNGWDENHSDSISLELENRSHELAGGLMQKGYFPDSPATGRFTYQDAKQKLEHEFQSVYTRGLKGEKL